MKQVKINSNAQDIDEYSFGGDSIKNLGQPKEDDVVSMSAMTETDGKVDYSELEFFIVDNEKPATSEMAPKNH